MNVATDTESDRTYFSPPVNEIVRCPALSQFTLSAMPTVGPLRRVPLLFLCLVAFTLARPVAAQRLSPLAPVPDWQRMEAFQETITCEEFSALLNTVYAPRDAWKGLIEIRPECAVIKTTLAPETTFTLRFAADRAAEKPLLRNWRDAAQCGPAPAEKPLEGIRIAIDPGHLGGAWARMEERYIQLDGTGTAVVEGDMTLYVAKLLKPKLEALGAIVTLVRDSATPTTSQLPETLREPARSALKEQGIDAPRETYTGPDDPERARTVQSESELLFYRTSEIRSRAALVNDVIRPDLTVCLHFNAEAWGDPKKPVFVEKNHLHLILNGCYSAAELRNDDIRFDMLEKLLLRCFPPESEASAAVAASMAEATGLPPYIYQTLNAISVAGNPYLWARNLLANRLYLMPVIFIEPYVMNSQEIWDRVQAGDYEGVREVAGKDRKSIYREYADGVAAGLQSYFAAHRPMKGVK